MCWAMNSIAFTTHGDYKKEGFVQCPSKALCSNPNPQSPEPPPNEKPKTSLQLLKLGVTRTTGLNSTRPGVLIRGGTGTVRWPHSDRDKDEECICKTKERGVLQLSVEAGGENHFVPALNPAWGNF